MDVPAGHPEIMFQEKYASNGAPSVISDKRYSRSRFAHDTLTSFMASKGFSVTPHYLGLDTAWRAEFTHGTGGRVIGVNSEMDALPGLGHACGHNLIAIGGVGIALALKAALQTHDVAGKIILLGTPG